MSRRSDYIFHAIWTITTIMSVGTIFHLFTRYAVVERGEAVQVNQAAELGTIDERLDHIESILAKHIETVVAGKEDTDAD